jgi:hypothetical protein
LFVLYAHAATIPWLVISLGQWNCQRDMSHGTQNTDMFHGTIDYGLIKIMALYVPKMGPLWEIVD